MMQPWRLLDGFLSDPAPLFAAVRNEVDWTQQMKARQTASMGIPYNYAGATYPEADWHPGVAAVAEHVQATFGFRPTNCLLNRYLSGDNSMGWHRDDITILAPDTGIVIVSLGAVRTLQLRAGEGPFTYTKLPLQPGSALHMTAAMQADYKHALKREPGAQERISLTFRHLTHASEPVTRAKWGA